MQPLGYQEDSAILWRLLTLLSAHVQSHNISTKSNFAFERLVNQVTTVFVHPAESCKTCTFAICRELYLQISSLHVYTLIWTVSRAEH